jgi:hypothetical protein
VRRLIAQSIAFVYAPGEGTRAESDPLDLAATGIRKRMVDGVVALEGATLEMPEGIVLRYGLLYGPGTWFENEKRGKPALHVDAAAQAALFAVTKGAPGIYNIAEDDGAVSSERPSATSASMRGFGSSFERLAQELRTFQPIAPQVLYGLGNPDARAGDDFRLFHPRAQFKRRTVERQAVVAVADAERLA